MNCILYTHRSFSNKDLLPDNLEGEVLACPKKEFILERWKFAIVELHINDSCVKTVKVDN